MVKYAPRYQRGFKGTTDRPGSDYDVLYKIDDPSLQIDPMRARAMAVKYLQGRLYTSHVTWNARRKAGNGEQTVFDEEQRSLDIDTEITIPDTGHRHLAYYMLVLWKEHRDEIPDWTSRGRATCMTSSTPTPSRPPTRSPST